jgi:hypothetical protein
VGRFEPARSLCKPRGRTENRRAKCGVPSAAPTLGCQGEEQRELGSPACNGFDGPADEGGFVQPLNCAKSPQIRRLISSHRTFLKAPPSVPDASDERLVKHHQLVSDPAPGGPRWLCPCTSTCVPLRFAGMASKAVRGAAFYDCNRNVRLPSGLVPELTRNGVCAGLSLWMHLTRK